MQRSKEPNKAPVDVTEKEERYFSMPTGGIFDESSLNLSSRWETRVNVVVPMVKTEK